ncbi:unnamed protein product [Allacma fusca]|uniref:Uncharacterized protein n=1 Tax=Allacma fusca TaxID=39272 RepID=A0A8J2L5Y8_9HEXA|nr:unnamed protein product [Allacma fusca]
MNSRLVLVLVALSTLAIASAKPAENGGLLSAIFENFQRTRRQEVAPPAPAVAPAEGMKNPAPVSPDSASSQPGEKGPEPDIFSRRQDQISSGVNTIVKGARGGDLESILRGSFSIPTNQRVQDRASLVLDSIFGNRS